MNRLISVIFLLGLLFIFACDKQDNVFQEEFVNNALKENNTLNRALAPSTPNPDIVEYCVYRILEVDEDHGLYKDDIICLPCRLACPSAIHLEVKIETQFGIVTAKVNLVDVFCRECPPNGQKFDWA